MILGVKKEDFWEADNVSFLDLSGPYLDVFTL